jgi:hypothetical protein
MSNGKKVVVTEGSSNVFDLEATDLSGIDIEIEEIHIQQPSFDEPDTTEQSNEDGVMIEDLDDLEQLWDGGPTAGLVKQWKEQFGEIYVTSVSYDNHIIWRVLNRVEYKQIVKKMEQLMESGKLSSAEANMWNEEVIANTCILYPAIENGDISSIMAGIPSLIAQEVLEASGFVALEVRQL